MGKIVERSSAQEGGHRTDWETQRQQEGLPTLKAITQEGKHKKVKLNKALGSRGPMSSNVSHLTLHSQEEKRSRAIQRVLEARAEASKPEKKKKVLSLPQMTDFLC